MRNLLLGCSLGAWLLVAAACGSAPPKNFFGEPAASDDDDNTSRDDNDVDEAAAGHSSSASSDSSSGGGTSAAGGASPAGTSSGGSPSNGSGGSGLASNSGGIAGSGGPAGAGGTPTIVDLIDEIEDNQAQIPERNGRYGFWNQFNDGTGQQDLEFALTSPARATSKFAVRSSGRNFKDWGAGVGVNLRDEPDVGLKPYDASAYKGISFWARASTQSLELVIQLPDASSHPNAKLCVSACNNHFLAKRGISGYWAHYTVNFGELARESDNGPPATKVASDAIFSVEFLVRPPASTFEFWIDDVAFIK